MTAELPTIHCFEKAGLGKAPFRYLGVVDQNIGADGQRVIGSIGGIAVETKPGGTCDYCGTAIINMFDVESSDGHRFHVGCECIRKTGDEGLIREVEADVRKMNRDRREVKKFAALKADRELCEATPLWKLASVAHPAGRFGETAADYAKWMMEQGYWKTLAVLIRRNVK